MKLSLAAVSVQSVDPAAVVRGLETFLADLKAGYPLAAAMIRHDGEMPMEADEWAAYPASPYRVEQIAELGAANPSA
jgi:hypothetical protein